MVEFNVSWDTGKQTGSNDLLTSENLAKVGVRAEDIKRIEPFFAFPGSLYTELGVARLAHPLCGSVGINITTNDGKTASIQDIFYYDYGHINGPLKNTPHWNREGRWVNTLGSEERVESDVGHVLKDTDSITIKFVDGTGQGHKQTINKN